MWPKNESLIREGGQTLEQNTDGKSWIECQRHVYSSKAFTYIYFPAATFILSVPMILYLSLSINMVTQDGLPTWKLTMIHMFWRECSNRTIVKVVKGVLQPLLSQLFLLNSKRWIRKLSTCQRYPLLYLQHYSTTASICQRKFSCHPRCPPPHH